MMYMSMDYQEAMSRLSLQLSSHRYQHSVNVAELCRQMAARYGIDAEKAYTAGLLHDCAKYLGDEHLIELCRDNGYEPDSIQQRNTQLLHSIAGAFVARDQYGVSDVDVLNSISNHTCGRPGMTPLEMLVFCADYCEVGRTHRDAEVAREMLEHSLEETTLHILDNVISYNEARGVTIHSASLETREFYRGITDAPAEGKEVF